MSRTTFSGPVASQNGFITVASTSGKELAIRAPAALSADTVLTFPNGAGSNGQQLTTDGTGVLSWSSAGGTGTVTSVAGAGTVNGLTLTGTVTSSGSLTLGGTLDLSSPPAIGNTAAAAGNFTALVATSVGVTNTSASTSLFEPVVVSSTLTGAGVTGGRAKFATTINSAAGSFSNALKADVAYGASGSTSGLGSAFVAEMTMSAGTSAGTYAPLEIELNAPTGTSTGTLTSFIHISTQGDAVGVIDDNARLFNVAGVTAGAGHLFQTGATLPSTVGGSLKIRVAGTDYYVVLYTSEVTA
jgi:hypothetical protein